jgi:iron complex transport system permease protein
MMSIKGRRILLLALLISIALFTLFALSVGSADLQSPWSYIFDRSQQGPGHEIIWEIRYPRVMAALLVGMALGVAGALSQSATNNPLADPSIIGTSAGASFGASLAIVLNLASVSTFGATIAAAVGALIASLVTFALARSALQLVIVGIATSALFTAITGLLISMADKPEGRSISFWSLGSLALVNMNTLALLTPLVLTVSIIGWYYSQKMDLLVLGDREVSHLGFNPQRMRLMAFIFISILIAVAVSTVGSIAFLALAAPHITRYLIGPSNRPLMIGSAVIGAGLLLVADTAARTLAAPIELPIGLITSLVGAPILILILRKSGEVWR